MNFYKHYIGDYQRDTGHLSLAEHGAYRLMLDTYYATEKPLPADRKTLYRLLRAETPTERKAIDSIVAQFWTVGKDGLINLRAITEIGKADKQAEVNRQIALAREEKKRQQKSGIQDNKVFKVYCNEKEDMPDIHDGLNDVPDFCEGSDPVCDCHEVFKVYCSKDENKVQEKDGTVRATKVEPGRVGMPAMGKGTMKVTNGEPNHSHNHNQTFKEEKTINERLVQARDEGKQVVFTSADLTKAMRETGIEAQSADPRMMALAAQGVSPSTVRAACEEARRAKPDERISAAYVVKIVERWAREAAMMNVRGARPAAASRQAHVFAERKRVLDGLTGRSEGTAEAISTFTDDGNTIEGEIVLALDAIKLTNADTGTGEGRDGTRK